MKQALRKLRRIVGSGLGGAAALFALMLLAAVFEALGVGLILPFMAIVSAPESIREHPLLAKLYMAVGADSEQTFLVYSCIAVLAVFVAKNSFLGFVMRSQYAYIYRHHVALSRHLMSLYLRSPYELHLERNTADLLNVLTREVNGVYIGVLQPALVIATETLVLLFIVAMLLSVNPVVTIAVLVVLATLALLYQGFFRPRLADAGHHRIENSAAMIKWANQGLGALKEVKVFGRENYFVQAFGRGSERYSEASRLYSTLSAVPRLFIETIGVASLLIVILALLMSDGEVRATIPVLALFAAAAIRLMPSASRLFAALSSIRFYLPSIDVVHADLVQLESMADASTDMSDVSSSPRPLLQKDIDIRGIGFRYGASSRPALKEVSLRIPRGSSVAVVGPSGAGKSTLIDLLLGLLEPTCGEIRVDGRPLSEIMPAWRRSVGYVPQSIYLLDDTVRRNVAFGVEDSEIDDAKVWRALALAHLEAKVTAFAHRIDTVVGERGARLSGGERQRLGIARALYHDPELLVFDEATSALDQQTESAVSEAIHQLAGSKTLVVIAHQMSTIRRCHTVCLLLDGHMAGVGSFESLSAESEAFRRISSAGYA